MTTKKKKLRMKFTYANVMAAVAVFLALGGASAVAASHLGRNTVGNGQLKRDAVTGAKVKDGSLGGADVVASTLGKVPAAAHAETATTAINAAVAASLTEPERTHFAGEPGEPKLIGGVKVLSGVGFYRDQAGAVHLAGEVEAGEFPIAVLQLPPGYRPEGDENFYGVGPRSASRVRVSQAGFVEIYAGGKAEPVSFDGIVYRADLRTEA